MSARQTPGVVLFTPRTDRPRRLCCADVELTPLRYFRAIAQAGHMTRAARSLGVSQPALSAMLKKLEAEVGAPLLDRTGRGVELTEAGRVFLVHAEDALRRAEAGVQAVRQLQGLEHGSIRVGGGATVVTYLLPPVVRRLRSEHPGLRFYVRETGSAAVAAAVASGELDLGVVTLPLPRALVAEVLATPIVEDELRLIVPPDGSRLPRAGTTAPFRWKDLAGVPVVAFEAGTAVRELVDAAARKAGVSLEVVMEVRSIESIKGMVAAGIGVGFVSRFALRPEEGLGPGAPSKESRLSRTLALVRRLDRTPSAAVRAFERAMRQAWSAGR
jgi:DNA-binding transcriptional LysR family regulator